jgi:hypothetical protein
MIITTSINAVGIVRAAGLIQQARGEAARAHAEDGHTVSVEIPRISDRLAQDGTEARPMPASQRRAIDLRV